MLGGDFPTRTAIYCYRDRERETLEEGDCQEGTKGRKCGVRILEIGIQKLKSIRFNKDGLENTETNRVEYKV